MSKEKVKEKGKAELTPEQKVKVKELQEKVLGRIKLQLGNQLGAFNHPREKNWGDLTVEEKLERTRAQIHGLDTMVRSMYSMIQKLRDHDHDRQGRVVGRLHDSTTPESDGRRQAPRGDVYF